MKLFILSLTLVASLAHGQTQSPTIGNGGGSIDQQIIGDTLATADRTQSTSNQIGNSANANGAALNNISDTRDQNTVTSTGGQSSATGNLSNNDNKSSASNGNQTMGQANTGNSSVGNTTTGPSTANATTGNNTNTNAAAGGAVKDSGNSSNANRNTNAQGQGQGQGQTQGIAGSGNSANRNSTTSSAAGGTGGASNASGGNSANRNAVSGSQSTQAGNGNGAAVTVSGDVYSSRAVAWAPIIHGPAAPALAAANVVMLPGQCGPRHELVKVDLMTTHHGVLWDSSKAQGYDYSVVPAAEPFVQRGAYLMGHQITEYTAVVGTSSGGSFSLGGFSSNGSAGQGGMASNGQVQQIAQRISIRDCVYATEKPVQFIIEAPKPVELPTIKVPAE